MSQVANTRIYEMTQTITLREVTHFYRDNDRFTVSLTYHLGNILIPVTKSQARTLVAAVVEGKQIVHHYPNFLGRSSGQFQSGNGLTAVMNKTGDSECLLSRTPSDRNHWLAQVAGKGVRFHKNIAYWILPAAPSQLAAPKPTLRPRYNYIENTKMDCSSCL
jgi:hypothetical protein